MRRVIASLAGVATAALVAPVLAAPANAQAQTAARVKPADPVAALQRQFVPNRGVQVTHHLKLTAGKDFMSMSVTGKLAFGRSEVTASDLRLKLAAKGDARILDEEGPTGPVRVITIGRVQYVSGQGFEKYLPVGKTWVRSQVTGGNGQKALLSPWADITDPALYRRLLASTKVKKPGGTLDGTATTLYAGAISIDRLLGTPPLQGVPSSARPKEPKLHWKLWLGRDLLPRRLSISETEKLNSGSMVLSGDSKFSGWGAKVVIAAPPADEVIDEKDVPNEPALPDVTFPVLPQLTGRKS
ncbi:hypothetical protein [Sphaerisporangium fuscum]|uniref:hypothetical protein n=1 Tax=Sphaerisporangium fuscum TaxID=2835868 RepID=UPI001BDD5A93|nr:hypothetical protein [Sphaerisporangium fuscum]